VDDDGQLNSSTVSNVARMAANLSGQARVRLFSLFLVRIGVIEVSMNEKKDYEEDFIKSKPSHNEYIRRLQQWRDRYEKHLDSRPRIQPLDLLSHYLSEFQYAKFDDIEVPGQYTEVCSQSFC
jgi:transformation/transcription domain-associated protein